MGILVAPYWNGARGFLALFCLVSILVQPCFGEIINHEWEVEYMHWAPDCKESIVMSINHKFPGPEIRAHVGDILHITVKNKLHTEGLVIHWHGILQKETPWADGTAAISQCAINPGESFLYNFTVDKPGTYFYHGHYGMQRAAGLYGSLIVELPEGHKSEPFGPYEKEVKEFNLLLSDWWHKGVHEQEVDMSAKVFRFIGDPQTLLINGKGQFNCSLIPAETQCKFGDTEEDKPKNGILYKEQCGPHILKVEPGKTYRLRVASTTSMVSLNLQIANHMMVVVEADGNYVEPFEVADLDVHSGESYSVLLKTSTNATVSSKNHWISVAVRGGNSKTPRALALLEYVTGGGYPESEELPKVPKWDDNEHDLKFARKLFGTENPHKPPQEGTTEIKLLNTQVKIDGYLKWAINGISLTLPATPYLGSIKYGLEDYEKTSPPNSLLDSVDITSTANDPKARLSSGFFKIERDAVIDVILQNANMLDKNHSEIHPWHLHGHDFWVLGYGNGLYTGSEKDRENFNLVNPPLKNTAALFPGGWTALRFKADNPGVWAFHCHIEPHLHMGMGVIFVEDEEGIKKLDVPNAAVGCGKTATHLMNIATKHLKSITPLAAATPSLAPAANPPFAAITPPIATTIPPAAAATPPSVATTP